MEGRRGSAGAPRTTRGVWGPFRRAHVISDILEQVLHGLTLGSMYAMVAAGLALMLGVASLINFAYGEFFMLGAYAFWLGYSELGLPYPVAALVAPAVMVVFGVAYQRTVIRAILPRSWHVQLIATLATSIVLTNLAIIVLGTQPKEVPTALSARILDVGGFRVAWQRLLVLVSSLIVFWGLHRFAARTRTGRAMRAMSQNREACAVVGVDVQRVTMVTFALSSALAALAAALGSPLFNIFPDMGTALPFALVWGRVGSRRLAHPAFGGAGAWAAAILAARAHWPFLAGVLAAALAAAGVAALVGVPLFRLTEPAFAVGPLGLALVAGIVANNWVEVTGGPLCITGIPKPVLGLPGGPT